MEREDKRQTDGKNQLKEADGWRKKAKERSIRGRREEWKNERKEDKGEESSER